MQRQVRHARHVLVLAGAIPRTAPGIAMKHLDGRRRMQAPTSSCRRCRLLPPAAVAAAQTHTRLSDHPPCRWQPWLGKMGAAPGGQQKPRRN